MQNKFTPIYHDFFRVKLFIYLFLHQHSSSTLEYFSVFEKILPKIFGRDRQHNRTTIHERENERKKISLPNGIIIIIINIVVVVVVVVVAAAAEKVNDFG